MPPFGNSFRESLRELAQLRARKAEWLPDEVDDSDEDLGYGELFPHEHVYLDGIKTQQKMDHLRKDREAKAKALRKEAERHRQAAENRAWEQMMENMDAKWTALEQVEQDCDALERAANSHIWERLKQDPSTAWHNPSRSRQYASTSVPINVHRTPSGGHSASSTPKSKPIPETKSQSPKSIYTEKHGTAASVIQQNFRIHQSLRTINNINSEFRTLKTSFVYPDVIDFQKPESERGYVSVPSTQAPSEFDQVEEMVVEDEGECLMNVDEPQPKLAYTADNYPIHSYLNAMEKLLMKLDGVESWGDKGVREKRRSVVKEIGKETAKLERYWKQSWVDYVEKQKEETCKELVPEAQPELLETMEIDEEPVHVEHPRIEEGDEWLDVAELESAVTVPSTEAPITDVCTNEGPQVTES